MNRKKLQKIRRVLGLKLTIRQMQRAGGAKVFADQYNAVLDRRSAKFPKPDRYYAARSAAQTTAKTPDGMTPFDFARVDRAEEKRQRRRERNLAL